MVDSNQIASARHGVSQAQAELSQIGQRLQFETQRCSQIQSRLTEIEKAKLVKVVALIDKAIETVSANGVQKIEQIVTDGLRIALNDPTLSLKIGKKKGSKGSSYELQVWRGNVTGPIFDTFGGGVWNIAAFLFRLIMIRRFNLAKVLIVDETFNNVSAKFVPMLSRLLRDLTHNHGYTILAVTHQPLLAWNADRIYVVKPRAGQSPVLERFEGTYADLSAYFDEINLQEGAE
jgi:DNA repair ATPase RecN